LSCLLETAFLYPRSHRLPTSPVHLSTAEFHARVHATNPTIAVFDCDGTLWSGDAGSTFMRWTLGEMDRPALVSRAQIDWINDRYEGYKAGTVSELDICGEMVQLYAGIPVDTLRAAAADFFATHIEPHIFPEMLELVTALQSKGVDIWAVSSTCDWVIEEGVKRFNIPANRVLAARVETIDGIASATLTDVPTDEGKVASLHNSGITEPHAVFGNSVHDAAMLAIARTPQGTSGAFPINPSADLLTRSAAEGWPVYFPASVAR
jgi:phosphoserine phosphatase